MDDALRSLERAARGAPRDAEVQFRLGAALVRAGHEDEAARALTAALVADPSHAGAVAALGRLPGLARGPWPTEDGGPDGGRRSAFPGARVGSVLRTVPLPAPPRGAAVVDAAGSAYVATVEGAFKVGRDGQVEEVGPRVEQRGPPVLASGRMLLLANAGELWSCGSGSGEWRRGLGPRAFEPLVLGDLALVGVEGRGVVALDLATGDDRWEVPIAAESFSRPTVAGGVLHVAARGDRPHVVRGYGEAWRWQLHAIDPRGPRVLWSSAGRPERDTGIPSVACAGPRDEELFVRVESELLVIRARDGAVVASVPATGPAAVGADGLARSVAGERLVGFDARGDEAWAGDPRGTYALGRVAVDGEGTTFVATNDRLAAIGRSGGFLWACGLARATSRPSIGNGCVLVTSFHESTVTWVV